MQGEPQTQKNLLVENGVKILYLRLLKDLYGCMESVILCYDLYSKTLKPQGFLINAYDRFISNITIQDKQCTISWYVEGKKVSHADEEVNKKAIETISEYFCNFIVSRRKRNKLLRMDIEFLADGKFY